MLATDLLRQLIHAVYFIRDTVKLRLEVSKDASLISCLVNLENCMLVVPYYQYCVKLARCCKMWSLSIQVTLLLSLTLSHVCYTRRAASPEGQAFFQNCSFRAIFLAQLRIAVHHATVGAYWNLKYVNVTMLVQQDLTQYRFTMDNGKDPKATSQGLQLCSI